MNKIKKELCKNCKHPLEEHYILNQFDVIKGEERETECNHPFCNCCNYEKEVKEWIGYISANQENFSILNARTAGITSSYSGTEKLRYVYCAIKSLAMIDEFFPYGMVGYGSVRYGVVGFG